MAKKIYEAECPYCGNDIEIDPYRNSKGYYTKPWKPQVGDIRQCPWCTWRYRVEGVHKTRLVLGEYINMNRSRRKEKRQRKNEEAHIESAAN